VPVCSPALRTRQLSEFMPSAPAVFQSTDEIAGRANWHTAAGTAVLAHCERHLADRRRVLNCFSAALCDRTSTAFCSQAPNEAHNLHPGQAVSTLTHSPYTQPRLRAQISASWGHK
jgi:hypothetical protein